uniref:BTB domain-containing protein n=1 Tax=Magallana gigas TaxID=29159 RepID=A0A8W8HMX3_MAGGI
MEKKFPPVIELNVGGKHYTTTLLTLVKCKDTMLAAMFSGNYDVKMDQHGRYFIDADGENFHYILNYLRYGELPPQEISPKIYREAVYFGLQGMVEELEKHPIFLAKIHRESFRAQFPGYTKLDKKPKLETFDKNHWCTLKSKNKKKAKTDFILGPWTSKSTEKEVMDCIAFDLRERGFSLTQEGVGQCSYKCDSPPDYPGEATVENCPRSVFKLTFYWWK